MSEGESSALFQVGVYVLLMALLVLATVTLWQFVLTAHTLPVVLVLAGTAYITYGVYRFIPWFLMKLDETYVAKPVQAEKDYS